MQLGITVDDDGFLILDSGFWICFVDFLFLRMVDLCRYYTTRIFIGNPPQEFALIVDSGSTVTYVPCSTCEQCGKHQASGIFKVYACLK